MIIDVLIIGGGASGLCSAIALKQRNPSLNVRIIEALPRVGKKLSTTGNGRCNITNKNINLNRYHGENVEFSRYALEKYGTDETIKFFETIGVPIIFEDEKAFPKSLQASSVVDCMRFYAEEVGVTIYYESKVTNIQISNGNYKITSDKISFLAKNIVIASGLYSGGEKVGNDGSILKILKNAGFKTVKTTPAIVQLKTPTEIVKQLKGIKINAGVTLKINSKITKRDFGEVLFCDYGLSGPPILQISRDTARTDKKSQVFLDIMSDKSFEELYDILENRVNLFKNRTLDEFFTGMLNKRLGQVIIKMCDCKLNEKVSSLNSSRLKKIVSLLKSMPFEIIANTGFNNSQVTAGGLDTKQFNPCTMESNISKGMYAVGEVLDIDGDCGGFNLQWAWSSAMVMADAINKKRDNI